MQYVWKEYIYSTLNVLVADTIFTNDSRRKEIKVAAVSYTSGTQAAGFYICVWMPDH